MSGHDGDGTETMPWHRVATVAILILIVTLASGAFLSSYSPVDGTVTLNATDGPEVQFQGLSSEKADLKTPFPDSNTVRWESSVGNVTVSASGQKNLTIDSVNGTWTKVPSLDGSGTTVTINPDDKQLVEINHSQKLEFRDITLGDGTADLIVSGDSTANVTVTALSAQDSVIARDSQGDYIDGAPVNNGNATIEVPGIDTNVYLSAYTDSSPGLSNPDPEGKVSGTPSQVSVDISDADFPDDEVTVEFYENGNKIGENRVTSDGTTSVSISPGLGKTQMEAVATDDYGNQQTLTWTFSTPENLTIRDVTKPDTIVDNRTVNATFFEGDTIVEKSTTNGNISMTDIPGLQDVIVSVDSATNTGETPNEYYPVENLIIDATEQSNIYLLPKTVSSRTVRFTLQDRTGGKFADQNDPVVLVQQPINRSSFSDPKWATVYSDEFGPQGATATLEDGQRYRIVVRNDQGDERVLGAYSADADETVQLTVGQLQAQPQGSNEEVAWNVTYDDSGSKPVVQFQYVDDQDRTDTIWIEIYEFKNKSNQLTTNQSFGGPYGNFTFSEVVPKDQENTTWTVDVTIERGDETITIKEPTGGQQPILSSLPTRWKTIVSIGTILLVGGLFSQFNGAYGALTMSALGAIFWLIGFLPPGTGIGVVVLAMVLAAALYLRERQVSGI